MTVKKTTRLLRWLILLFILLAVFVYVLSFVLSNKATSDVDFVFYQLQGVAVELLVLASFIAGGVFGLLSASGLLLLSYRKNKRLLRQYRQHMG